MQKKLMLEVHEEEHGLEVVRHEGCPQELGDFIEGCIQWLQKSGLVYNPHVQKARFVN